MFINFSPGRPTLIPRNQAAVSPMAAVVIAREEKAPAFLPAVTAVMSYRKRNGITKNGPVSRQTVTKV
jgi:hypothetical protein